MKKVKNLILTTCTIKKYDTNICNCESNETNLNRITDRGLENLPL